MSRLAMPSLRISVLASFAISMLSIGPVHAQSVAFTPMTGPCSGTLTYSIPHLSTETDKDGNRFTSAVALANLSATQTATIEACAYGQDGSVIGATTFHLPPGHRIFAVTPKPPSDSTNLALSDMFDVPSGLPDDTEFHAIFASDNPIIAEAGFIGEGGAFFLFDNAARSGTVLGSAHFGHFPQFQGSVFVANLSGAKGAFTVELLNNDGTDAFKSAAIPINAYARYRSRIADLVDANGNKFGQNGFYSMRVTSTGTVPATIAGWGVIVTGWAEAVAKPMQVVQ